MNREKVENAIQLSQPEKKTLQMPFNCMTRGIKKKSIKLIHQQNKIYQKEKSPAKIGRAKYAIVQLPHKLPPKKKNKQSMLLG